MGSIWGQCLGAVFGEGLYNDTAYRRDNHITPDFEAVDDIATSLTEATPLCKVHDLSLSESVKVTWKDENSGTCLSLILLF